MLSQWESREQVLGAASAAGYSVSPPQLGRLHRAGLVPAPEVKPLGRGRGTESRYPLGTAERLIRVMEIRARDHRLTAVAWRLWWEDGGAVPTLARKYLIDVAEGWDTERTRLRAMLEGDEIGDPVARSAVDALYDDAEHGRVSGVLGRARRNTGRERFALVVRVLAEIGTGQFKGYGETEAGVEAGALVERAFELDRARSDHLSHSPPWFSGETEADFRDLSTRMVSQAMADVARATDLELDLARVELGALIDVLTSVAPLFERLFGRKAFGFGLLTDLVGQSSPRAQAGMLLGWLVLRQDETLRGGLERIAAVAPQAEATVQLYRAFAQMRQEIPALAGVLTDERLASAQLDPTAADALNSDIADLRERETEPFEAFFAARPEIQEWLAVVEDSSSDGG